MINSLDRVSCWVARATDAVVITMASLMMMSLILQVFFRYFLGSSLVWSEELALMLFTWATLLAATSVLRDMAHVRLDMLMSAMPAGLGFWPFSTARPGLSRCANRGRDHARA